MNGNIVAAMLFQRYSIFIKNGRAVTYIFTMQGVYIIESNKNGAAFYELSLGWYDSDRDHLRDGYGAFAGSVGGGDSVFEGGGESVRGDGGGYGTLGGDDADRGDIRTFGGDGAADAADYKLPVSGDSREPSGEKVDCCESAGERTWTRLGGDTGRAEGHGRTGRSGGRAAKEKAAGSADRCSQQRDVRFPDPKYFLPATDSGQHYCLPDGIRKRGTHSDRGTGDSCNGGQHRDCHILY